MRKAFGIVGLMAAMVVGGYCGGAETVGGVVASTAVVQAVTTSTVSVAVSTMGAHIELRKADFLGLDVVFYSKDGKAVKVIHMKNFDFSKDIPEGYLGYSPLKTLCGGNKPVLSPNGQYALIPNSRPNSGCWVDDNGTSQCSAPVPQVIGYYNVKGELLFERKYIVGELTKVPAEQITPFLENIRKSIHNYSGEELPGVVDSVVRILDGAATIADNGGLMGLVEKDYYTWSSERFANDEANPLWDGDKYWYVVLNGKGEEVFRIADEGGAGGGIQAGFSPNGVYGFYEGGGALYQKHIYFFNLKTKTVQKVSPYFDLKKDENGNEIAIDVKNIQVDNSGNVITGKMGKFFLNIDKE